jgi:hypothetical protein
MCPSGNVKVFSAGAACFADEAGTADADTALVAGTAGAAEEAERNASAGVGSAVSFTVTFEAAAEPVPGCSPHPASTRPTAKLAIVTAVKIPARLEFIVVTPNICDGGLNVPLDI